MFYKSLTINERYNILKGNGIVEKENTDALIQWRNDMSLLSEEQFQKMMQYNQYDRKIFSHAVVREPDEDIVEMYEKSEQNHPWRRAYWEILNTDIPYEEESFWSQDKGFNYIVRHFVKYVEKKLMESLTGIKFTKDCLNGILHQFTLKLVDLGNKAMIMELNHFRESQKLKGNTSAERFKYFVSLFDNIEFLEEFFEKYIVLARLYTELSILFINNINKIWADIRSDKEILKEKFGISNKNFVLYKVSMGIGDTHNFGKTVTILEFANSKKIVYKPKNLKINEVYNSLIDFLNKTGKLEILKSLKSISFKDHGYEEFLDHNVCETEYELHCFYIRFGEILALSYILNATDLHMENLIAHGEYPVLIDLETFIQQPNNFNDEIINEKINYEFDSVKRTLLLESRLRQNEVSEGVDISAINGQGYVVDDILLPINMYTDMARYEKQRVQVKGAKNLPFLEEDSRDIKNYVNEILLGFSKVYDLFLEFKDDISFKNIIKQFAGIRVRHIIRNTDQYDTILKHSTHPEHLTDMLDREKILENMWSSSAYAEFVVLSEVNGMRRNDIPFFYRYTDSNSIYNDMDQEKSNYFECNAYSKLIKNIENLSINGRERQKSFIHLALDYQNLILDGKCIGSYIAYKEIDMQNEHCVFTYLEKAKNYAVKIAKEYTWFAPVLNNFGKWNYDLVDTDLYDGIGGITLIAHYYEKDKKFQDDLIKIMESRCKPDMLDFYVKQRNVGLGGAFGIFHTLSFMKEEYINQPRIDKLIEFFYNVLEQMINNSNFPHHLVC
ncbi:type 2 lanthipeptide synthetase LanM [Blautia sp. HCP3S3_D9]|uniref:type 2 lanthipeptide synthetase LanM n=1 Tax=Blautia sp. HCP3S3_D9 TaxID=3438912 RepID=UPI003F8A8824